MKKNHELNINTVFVQVAQIRLMQAKNAKNDKKDIHSNNCRKTPKNHLYTKLYTLSTEKMTKKEVILWKPTKHPFC